MPQSDTETQTDAWREELRRAAREALDLAGMQGLCTEGKVELAVSAMRELAPQATLSSETAEAIREAQIQGLLQRGGLD